MTRKAHTNGGDLYLLNFGSKAVMAQPSKPQAPTKEMVQAVRECVPGRSNHEIHLVLQYYDYDVETTIQAFVENGAVEALKDWHHAGSAKNVGKRGKKAKNKAAPQADDAASANAAVAPAPSAQLDANGCLSDVSSATVQSQQQAASGDLTSESSIDAAAAADAAAQLAQEQDVSHRGKQADSTLASSADDPSLHQHRGSVGGLPDAAVNSAREAAAVGDVGADDRHAVTRAVVVSAVPSFTTSHDNTRLSRNVPSTVAGKSGGNRLPSAAPATSADAFRGTSNAGAGRHTTGHGAGHAAGLVQHSQHSVPAAHSKPHAGLEKSVKDLQRQNVSLAHLQLHFNDECEKSLKKIKAVFEQLRSGLNDREADLMYQLDKAKDAGGEIFTSRLNKAAELKVSCDRCPGVLVHAAPGSEAAHVAERQLADLRTDIKHFVSERKVDEELSRAAHFIVNDTDIADLLATIQSFGEVVPVRNGYSSSRRLSSSSACSGTDGDDAGARMHQRTQQQQQRSQLSAASTTANGRIAAAAISELVSVKSRTTARSLTGSADSGAGRQSAAASDAAPSGTAVAAAAAPATSSAGPRATAAAGEDKRITAPYDAQRLAASVQLPTPHIATGSTSVPSPPNDKDVARTDHTLAGSAAAPVTSGDAQVDAVLQLIEAAANSVSSSAAGTPASTAAAPGPAAARERAVSDLRQLPTSERPPTEEVHNQQPPCRDWSEEVVESDAKPELHGTSNGYRPAYNDASGRAGGGRYRGSNQHDGRMRGSHQSRPHDDDQRHSRNGYDGYRNASGGMGSRVYRRSPSSSNGSYYAEPRSSIDSQRWQQQLPSQTDSRRPADSRAEPVAAAAAEPSMRLNSAATGAGNFRQGSDMASQEVGAGIALSKQAPSISLSRSELRESNGSSRSSVRYSEGDNGSGFRGGRNRGGRQGHGRGSIPAGSGDPIGASRRFGSRRDEQLVLSSPVTSDAGAAVTSVGGMALSGGDNGDKTGADSGINAAALVARERVKSGRSGGYRGGRGRGAAPAGDRSVPSVAGGGGGGAKSAPDALPQRQPRHGQGRRGGPPRPSATHPTNEDGARGSIKDVDAFDRPGSSFSATTAAAGAATTTEAAAPAAAATAAVGRAGAQE